MCFDFVWPGPGGGLGGPQEAPQSPPWAFPEPLGASRMPRHAEVIPHLAGWGGLPTLKPRGDFEDWHPPNRKVWGAGAPQA